MQACSKQICFDCANVSLACSLFSSALRPSMCAYAHRNTSTHNTYWADFPPFGMLRVDHAKSAMSEEFSCLCSLSCRHKLTSLGASLHAASGMYVLRHTVCRYAYIVYINLPAHNSDYNSRRLERSMVFIVLL